MAEQDNVTELRPQRQIPTNGNGGGNGGVLEHRVTEIERRLSVVESDLKQINNTCIEINTKLEDLATNSFVWKIFAGMLGLVLLSLVGHALIRVI